MALPELDAATQLVAQAIASAYEGQLWQKIRYVSRWTPAGDVGSDDFWVVVGGSEEKRSPDEANKYLVVSDAAYAHWKLTQELGLPRWYQMTVTVHRDGKYSVDFEYRDDYQEGDIMKPLE